MTEVEKLRKLIEHYAAGRILRSELYDQIAVVYTEHPDPQASKWVGNPHHRR